MVSRLDRYRGAMLGTLCGDALGAPYEWKKSAEIKADIERRGGLVPHKFAPFDYIDPWKGVRQMRAGQPTDDSELAAALAMSLIDSHGLNGEDLFAKLRSFIIDRKSVLTDLAYGSGSTLKAALTPPTREASQRLFAAGAIKTPPSNGSLMRCVAIPLMFGADTALLIATARAQSRVTHQNPLSVAACIAYSIMVSLVLSGNEPLLAWCKTAININATTLADDQAMQQVLKIPMWRVPDDSDIWPPAPRGPGDAVTSLWAAVWASCYAKDFADGILKVIGLGGDTDTYAAIAGGILGAHFGYQGIPAEWKAPLQGREIMERLASQLHEIALR